jgi:hypothetical protein
MSRTISLNARRAINAAETGEVFVFLLTVEHASLETPLRFSTDNAERPDDDGPGYGTTSRGNFYSFLPVSLMLPDDAPDAPPAFRLSIDNVARTLVPLLRSIATPAQVTIEMVLASAPDIVEAAFPPFDLQSAQSDAQTVAMDLGLPSMMTEPYPAGTFSPASFPGLFT